MSRPAADGWWCRVSVRRRSAPECCAGRPEQSAASGTEVVLPDQIDGGGIEATMKDGVLRLRVPKSKTADRRRIEVK